MRGLRVRRGRRRPVQNRLTARPMARGQRQSGSFRCCQFLILLSVAMLSVSSELRAQTDTAANRTRADLVRKYPCSRLSFSLVPVRGELPSGACSIATFALYRIASGDAEGIGVKPGDTTAIRTATVRFLRFKDLTGGPTESYWLVSFVLRNRRLPIEVRIEAGTGRTSVSNGERSAKVGS